MIMPTEEECILRERIAKLEQKLEDSAIALEVSRVANRSWSISIISCLTAAAGLVAGLAAIYRVH